MRVLIYATNQDRAFVAAVKKMHAMAKSTDLVAQRNPQFHHGPADVEKCKAVIVRPQWTAVIRDYEAAGIQVSVFEPEKQADAWASVTGPGPVETKEPVAETEIRFSEPEVAAAETKAAEIEPAELVRPPEERGTVIDATTMSGDIQQDVVASSETQQEAVAPNETPRQARPRARILRPQFNNKKETQ